MSKADLYERAVDAWTDAELVAELTKAYAPSVIPPCRICGGALSLGASGGGLPSYWSCSPEEEDPDRPGQRRTKPGRGERETHPEGHYARSQYIDRRQGGDARVMGMLRRFVLTGVADPRGGR
jgi:hypothetical protein